MTGDRPDGLAALPDSLRDQAAHYAAKSGTSMQEFLIDSIAARIRFLAEIEAMSIGQTTPDWTEFDRIMSRSGGMAPRDGDVIANG
jgi:hypothetical protein